MISKMEKLGSILFMLECILIWEFHLIRRGEMLNFSSSRFKLEGDSK